MKEITLECFKSFRCIADKCKDNCCIGWEIDIDDDTFSYYNTLTGDIRKRLDDGIDKHSCPPHFILGENERCPFLNCNNLCDIILSLGEDKIPYICKNHPRFYTWLDDRTESGIGLCCEVGADLLFSQKDKLNTEIPYTLSDNLSDVMTYAREVAFSILQNRTLGICERLSIFSDYCDELDNYLFFEDTDGLKNVADSYKNYNCSTNPAAQNIDNILGLFTALEPIDDNWTKLITELSSHKDELCKFLAEFQKINSRNFYKYEHLSVYFTYRHFLGCLEDFNVSSAGRFIVLSVIFCALCDAYSLMKTGNPYTEKNAKLYSKQVEYSNENTDAVRDSEIYNIKELLTVIFGR